MAVNLADPNTFPIYVPSQRFSSNLIDKNRETRKSIRFAERTQISQQLMTPIIAYFNKFLLTDRIKIHVV